MKRILIRIGLLLLVLEIVASIILTIVGVSMADVQ